MSRLWSQISHWFPLDLGPYTLVYSFCHYSKCHKIGMNYTYKWMFQNNRYYNQTHIFFT